MTDAVLCLRDIEADVLHRLLRRHGLEPVTVGDGEAIPGSYWGAPEAGLVGNRLYLRRDTPVHSALHEASHFICMGPERQKAVDRDAGGDFDEENAVCYLQILLADDIPGCGRHRMMADMDRWGYSFRLGSARRWFEEDAGDARDWLRRRVLAPGEGEAG